MSVPSAASFRLYDLLRQHREFLSYTNTSLVTRDELAMKSLPVPLISVSSFSNEGATVAHSDFDVVASSSRLPSPLNLSGTPAQTVHYRALYESFVSTRSRVVQVRGRPIAAVSRYVADHAR